MKSNKARLAQLEAELVKRAGRGAPSIRYAVFWHDGTPASEEDEWTPDWRHGLQIEWPEDARDGSINEY